MLGTTIGHYRVDSFVGRGGMGEVYRARDLKLGRDVALKVLPPGVADDPDRRGRFEREARLLASLQHQNIASIYGYEEYDGQPILVMEYADGEDLSVRLEQGPLDVDEVLRIASRLARGLEFAHERGIVHRDLKPGNIKLGHDGRVKILDFGLARALDHAADAQQAASAAAGDATVAPELTQMGTVLGTASYMSPEQARGYAVDRRTDIWAYGVVLTEMLTGQRPFRGESRSDILAAVLRERPDLSILPPDTPALLRQLIRRCLEKDPRVRLRDMGEVRVALDDGSASMLTAPAIDLALPRDVKVRPRRRQGWLPWALVGVLVLVLAAVTVRDLRSGSDVSAMPLLQAVVPLPGEQNFFLNPANPGTPVVSPDGRAVAYTASDSTGIVQLQLLTLATGEVRVIPQSTGASYPFWSPDSRSLAFFTEGSLNRLDLAGGPLVRVCEAHDGKGGTWSNQGVILFTPDHMSPIHQVPAGGGVPIPVTSLEASGNALSHRLPAWLPDGRRFLYLARYAGSSATDSRRAQLRLASLDGTEDRELMICQTGAQYLAGRVYYLKDQVLTSRAFDSRSGQLTGEPVTVLGGVLNLQAAHLGAFSMSESVLCYVADSGLRGRSELHWLTPGGTDLETVPGTITSAQGLEISPDGKQLAISQVDPATGTFDLWLDDLDRAAGSRFTYEAESEVVPRWSPDGRWLAYAAVVGQRARIFRKPTGGTGQAELLVENDQSCFPCDWSPDGARLLYSTRDASGDHDLWILDLARPEQPVVFRDTPFAEASGRFSPDGRWIAYHSTETGQWEVFVEAVDGQGGRRRISDDSGGHPRWSLDGRTLYYLDLNGRLLATDLAMNGTSLEVGETRTLAHRLELGLASSFAVNRADGRLLTLQPVSDPTTAALRIVTGWHQLMPADR